MVAPLSRRVAISAAAVGAALAIAGCGSYDRGQAESTIVEDLSSQVKEVTGSPIESASCPENVELEAGTTFDCVATLKDGDELTVSAEIVDDEGNAQFNVSPEELGKAIDPKG